MNTFNLEEFKNDYANNDTKTLCNKYNLTKNEVYSIAGKHKLYKSKEHKSRMIARRNKMVARDLSYDLVKSIAIKCKSRVEFQKMDGAAYKAARISGYLDEICSHMLKQTFSIPQLMTKYIFDILLNDNGIYNTRKIIKPLELDVYYPNYNFAIEYNGKGWHNNENSKNIEKNKKELCKRNNIFLLILIENSRKYEEDIKNQIIQNIDNINSQCNIFINKENVLNIKINNKILFKDILNFEDVEKITQKYKIFSEFKHNEPKLYSKLINLKLLNEYTKHMIKKNQPNNIQKVKSIIDKYEYINDLLISKDVKYYTWCCKNDKSLLNNLKYKNNKTFKEVKTFKVNYNYINNNCNDCFLLKDIIKKHHNIYNYCIKNNKMEIIYKFLQKQNYNMYFDSLEFIDFNKIKKLCKKYKTIKKFYKDNFRILLFLRKNNLLDEYFSHIDTFKYRKKS